MQVWELEIREMVRQTLADYTAATDGFDLGALASCFAPNGTLEFTGGGDALVGRDGIIKGLTERLSVPRSGGRSPRYVRHHVSSIRIFEVGRQRADTSSYFAVFTDVGVDHWGRYRDVLIPHDGRWLFASRRIRVDGFSSASPKDDSARSGAKGV